jgi:transcription elongation factor GreA
MPSVYLTREGRDKLEEELKTLKQIERPKVMQAISDAREKGDLSENAEYDAAKDEQRLLEGRIVKLQDQLSHAILIDDQLFPKGEAHIGRKVEIEDMKTGRNLTYMLVSEAESDFSAGKISTMSPVGKGLVGHSEGEEVEIEVPAGIKRYRILKVGGGGT